MGVNRIAPTIMKYGTDEQKARFLPEIAAGAVQWAQLFSEPDAGTDLAALRTVALVDGDTFVINGEKVWTSYANLATRGYLLCRTDPTAERHHGISVLLVDMKDAGIEVREIPSSVGWHRFHSVVFNDVRVPSGALLGPLNGGWQVAMDALPFERVGNARYARSTRILGLLEQASTDGGSRRDAEDDICDALALGRVPPSWPTTASSPRRRRERSPAGAPRRRSPATPSTNARWRAGGGGAGCRVPRLEPRRGRPVPWRGGVLRHPPSPDGDHSGRHLPGPTFDHRGGRDGPPPAR